MGCAKGSLVCAFRDLGISAYGVDVSEYAIASAPDYLRKHLYVVDMDRDTLPFKDGFFDFVTFLGSIVALTGEEAESPEGELLGLGLGGPVVLDRREGLLLAAGARRRGRSPPSSTISAASRRSRPSSTTPG